MPKRACKQCDQYNIVYKRGDLVIPKFCGRTCMDAFFADKSKAEREAAADRAKYAKSIVRVKPKSAKPKKKKLKSIARLVDEAAVLLQKLVRMKAADENGYCKCVTCGNVHHWKELQGGHLIERGKTAVKLLEEQVNPQCEGCNGFGMKFRPTVVLAYRRFMVDRHGEDFVRWLEQEAFKVKKYTRSEVEGIIFDLKRQIQSQEARLAGRGEQEIAA